MGPLQQNPAFICTCPIPRLDVCLAPVTSHHLPVAANHPAFRQRHIGYLCARRACVGQHQARCQDPSTLLRRHTAARRSFYLILLSVCRPRKSVPPPLLDVHIDRATRDLQTLESVWISPQQRLSSAKRQENSRRLTALTPSFKSPRKLYSSKLGWDSSFSIHVCPGRRV